MIRDGDPEETQKTVEDGALLVRAPLFSVFEQKTNLYPVLR